MNVAGKMFSGRERIVNMEGCEEALVGGLLGICQIHSKLVQERLLPAEDCVWEGS